LLGTLFGVGLGIVLGQGAVRAVTQTINDLFFVLTVRGVQIPPLSLIKGVLIGLLATIASAAPPAWEAASVPPREALSRANLEVKAGRTVIGLALAGAVLILVGVGALALPLTDLTISFSGTFAVIVGFAMLTPLAMKGLMRLVAPWSVRIGGALGRMAPRGVVGALSRTSVAVAALMVAVSVTIGISLMVSSFRHTVVVWLEHTLRGDIYLTAPEGASRSRTFIVDPVVLDLLESWPGVERVDSVRTVEVESPLGPVQVSAIQNPSAGSERLFLAADGSPQDAWAAVEDGAVIVSEPFARRHNIPHHGGEVTLYTVDGPHIFSVVGIYYDYGSTQGTVMMAQAVYRDLWGDDAITGVALRLAPGADVDAITRDLRGAIAPLQRLSVQPNRAFRDEVLVIFDRTFAITGALNLLAMLVAFVGVLSALLSLQLEKQRELGIMRAVGLTVRQLWGLVMLECGLMGAVAGLLAMPTGFVLSLILVYIINRRSFGWTLQMQVTPGPFIWALAVAVVAALLAGIYPARRMSRMVTSEAIRFE
jgi:putative ABC transport system permease protein